MTPPFPFFSFHSPFFDEVTIDLPSAAQPLRIRAPGAPRNPYIASLSVNGREVTTPVIHHADIANGAQLVFNMSAKPTSWGSNRVVGSFNNAASCGLLRSLYRIGWDYMWS